MKRILLSAVLFLLPTVVSAATLAQAPLFLSKSPVTEGQKVKVYSIVSNDQTTAFVGTVVLAADGTTLGSPAVSLAAGATQTVSANWTPTAGSHTVTAQLTSSDGTVIQQVSQAFTIQALPTPAADTSTNTAGGSGTNTPTNGVQSSAQIQQSIANVSPAVEQYSAPVFNAIDSGRVAAAQQLNNAVTWSKQQIGAPVTSSTSNFIKTPTPETQNKTASSIWTIVATAVLYVLTVLLYIVSSAGIFYPVLALIFFYILWRLWRRYRRKY